MMHYQLQNNSNRFTASLSPPLFRIIRHASDLCLETAVDKKVEHGSAPGPEVQRARIPCEACLHQDQWSIGCGGSCCICCICCCLLFLLLLQMLPCAPFTRRAHHHHQVVATAAAAADPEDADADPEDAEAP